MIVTIEHAAGFEPIEQVLRCCDEYEASLNLTRDKRYTRIRITVDQAYSELFVRLKSIVGVAKVETTGKPYPLAAREAKSAASVINVRGIEIGGSDLVVMAGPCSVESREQILATAHAVRAAGARILRGGAYKPRTSPYDFRGLGEEGLQLLAEAREATGLAIVTEVMSIADLELGAYYADIIQIGARNMQNFSLLHACGSINRPILLKRGPSATIEEWLLAAEYILAAGNEQVILCERGIRTYEPFTRNTFDVSAIASIKHLSHLPIIGDPSHGVGKAELVPQMARAAIAAGADGLIIEVHPNPAQAWSDGQQSLTFEHFEQLMNDLAPIANALGRQLNPNVQALVVS
uniref:SphI n=1 Tax=Herpetosiphon sp. B060 TaxID=2002978 RepID=A0A2Z2H080_9CHLR|nr:SphI [Herpetosiphon sp. B060]